MLLSWDRKRSSGPRFFPCGRRLGPYCCRRDEASAASSPASLVPRRFRTSSVERACQAFAAAVEELAAESMGRPRRDAYELSTFPAPLSSAGAVENVKLS